MGLALSPVDVEAIRAESQEHAWKATLWDVQNVAVAFVTAFTACLTLFSTYLLLEVAVEPTPSGLYRSVARLSNFISLLAFALGVLLWLLIYMLMVALALRSSALAFRLGFLVVLAPCLAFTAYFMETVNAAFPSAGIVWSTIWWPPGIRTALRADAKRSGAARVAEAVSLHGADAAPFIEEAVEDQEPSKEAAELEAALATALPHATHARRENLANSLLRAGLTLGVLRAGAAHSTALSAVLDKLGDFGATLLPGELLALITHVSGPPARS